MNTQDKQKEHELWYFLAGSRIAKTGIKTAHPWFWSMQEEAERNGHPDMFSFEDEYHYMEEFFIYFKEAKSRNEVTPEMQKEFSKLVTMLPTEGNA